MGVILAPCPSEHHGLAICHARHPQFSLCNMHAAPSLYHRPTSERRMPPQFSCLWLLMPYSAGSRQRRRRPPPECHNRQCLHSHIACLQCRLEKPSPFICQTFVTSVTLQNEYHAFRARAVAEGHFRASKEGSYVSQGWTHIPLVNRREPWEFLQPQRRHFPRTMEVPACVQVCRFAGRMCEEGFRPL